MSMEKRIDRMMKGSATLVYWSLAYDLLSICLLTQSMVKDIEDWQSKGHLESTTLAAYQPKYDGRNLKYRLEIRYSLPILKSK